MVDLGSHTVKAGYAGEDTPKAVFPSAVGWLAKDQESAGRAGTLHESTFQLHLRHFLWDEFGGGFSGDYTAQVEPETGD